MMMLKKLKEKWFPPFSLPRAAKALQTKEGRRKLSRYQYDTFNLGALVADSFQAAGLACETVSAILLLSWSLRKTLAHIPHC